MNFFQWSNNNTFETKLRVHSMAVRGTSGLDNGGKILLPPSALDTLTRLNISWPVFFNVRNPKSGKTTHCGVQEFTAEQGTTYFPFWMMKHLGLNEGDVVVVRQVDMMPGTYCKIQPHSKDFLDISNPRAVLEKHLRDYSCMTTGDVFVFQYNDKKFAFNVLEVRPGNAVSIVETDMNVDFAPPVDYVEPVYEKPKEVAKPVLEPELHVAPTLKNSLATSGEGRRLGGEKKVKTEAAAVAAAAPTKTRLTLGAPATAVLQAATPSTATASAAAAGGAAGAAPSKSGMSEAEMKKAKEDYWAKLAGGGHKLK